MSKGKKRGRHTKLTPEVIQKVDECLRIGNYVNTACQYVGISEAAYYNWLERGRVEAQRLDQLEAHGADIDELIKDNDEYIFVEFMETVKKAEVTAEVIAITHIRNAMRDNWQAAGWFAERKNPARWGRKDRSVNINVDATDRPDLSKLSDSELEIMESILEKATTEVVRH